MSRRMSCRDLLPIVPVVLGLLGAACSAEAPRDSVASSEVAPATEAPAASRRPEIHYYSISDG